MKLINSVASLLLFTLAPVANAASGADAFVPKDFDLDNRYRTFLAEELIEGIEQFTVSRDQMSGKKAKVFGRIPPPDKKLGLDGGLNFRLDARDPQTKYGCKNQLCNELEYVYFYKYRHSQLYWLDDVRLMIRFRDANVHSAFLSDVSRMCSTTNMCLIWAKGTLAFAEIPFVDRLGEKTKRVVFVEAEDVRLYKSTDNEYLRSMKAGAQMGLSIVERVYKLPSIR